MQLHVGYVFVLLSLLLLSRCSELASAVSCFHDAAHVVDRDESLRTLLALEADDDDVMEQDDEADDNPQRKKLRLQYYFKVSY